MANFSYGAQDEVKDKIHDISPIEEELTQNLLIALRDTCVLNYRRSYDKVNNEDWS